MRNPVKAARGSIPRPAPAFRLGAGVAAVGLLISGGLAACSSSGSGAGSSPSAGTSAAAGATDQANVSSVTLNIGDQAGSGSEALLTAAGLINKLPFKAHWADFTSGPPMLQAMAAGSIDVGGVGDAPPVFAAASGGQIAVVSALQTDIDSAAILVPKNSPITSVAQLKGKKIAVAQGSSANYQLLAALTKAGLTMKEVTPDYLQPADAEAAFASGHVDAWAVWTPYIELAEAQDHARIIANNAGLPLTYSFEVASRAALSNPQKSAAIQDYLKLLDQAYKWSATHQSTWAATWAKATGLPESVMLQAVKDDTDVPTAITPTVITSEQGVANAFSNSGLIPAKIDFSNFAVTTYNSILGG
jgi:sulfonate transport system substrate-binding protein